MAATARRVLLEAQAPGVREAQILSKACSIAVVADKMAVQGLRGARAESVAQVVMVAMVAS